jgi:hypothetical protein
MWKLLIIESFSQWKLLNRVETENSVLEFGGVLGVVGKPLMSRIYYSWWGPAPTGTRDYRIGSNFWKSYLIRTGFTLGELVSLTKVFRLFRLERIFLGVQSVDTVGRCKTSYLLAGPACFWCLVSQFSELRCERFFYYFNLFFSGFCC